VVDIPPGLAPPPPLLPPGATVLVAERLPNARRALAQQISALGGTPLEAPGVAEALALLRTPAASSLCAAVIGHCGERAEADLELTRSIRQDAALAHLPLVLCLPASLAGQWMPQPELAAAVLTRPVLPARLRCALAELLGQAQPLPPALPGLPAPGGPPRILLAEDNATNQLVMRTMLQSLGCRVDMVPDGASAVARARRLAYDAILMDLQMPAMDGLEATRAIRRTESRESRVRIVGLTAAVGAAIRQDCTQAGMDGCLSKPVQRAELAAALGLPLPLSAN
jgi:CheY-like chemotaxis protein